jgi:hypothetical protein
MRLMLPSNDTDYCFLFDYKTVELNECNPDIGVEIMANVIKLFKAVID